MVRRNVFGSFAAVACALLATSHAHALDLPKLLGKPLTLDVTEVTIVAQRFDSREVDPLNEGGAWGQWINRLNAKLDWNHFTVGVRLDSAVYWNTLAQQCSNPNGVVPSADETTTTCKLLAPKIARDDLARYQNSIYPAKIWATYKNKGVEITFGDAYVQFARGLVLSMRKLDDLGIDNTIRGVKASYTKGPFAVTIVGGMANPSRVDEATGEALFVSKRVTDQNSPVYTSRLEQPVYGADQIFGAEIQAGRESPVVATTSMSYLNRCAPHNYTAIGRIFDANAGTTVFGACDDDDVGSWLSSLPSAGSIRTARHVSTVAQSIELPKMGKFGSLYVVGAVQMRDGIGPTDVGTYDQGTALYATYTGSINKHITNTVEFKDYRNFYPEIMSANATQVSAFSQVGYSSPPTIESIQQDNMLGNFNVCVDGVRVRTDVRVSKPLLLYGQGIFTYSKGEQNAQCNKHGDLIAPEAQKSSLSDYVADGLVGMQYEFDQEHSHLYATAGGRQDYLGTGNTYIQQLEVTYNFEKFISKKVSVEFLGRHRIRYERGDNVGPNGSAEAWVEGENYAGLSIAPKWVITQGFEYTTRDLPASTRFAFIDDYPAWLFLSLGGVYKFTKDSNIRLFVGQQRGGLKCISGVCRIYPPFEGARLELTLRF